MSRQVIAHVNLDAARHNLKQVKSFTPDSRVLAMVKCNAYGHGACQLMPALDSADALGVASLSEAKQLREAGVVMPIVLMGGLFDIADWTLADALRCDLVVHEPWQVSILQQLPESASFRIWLKLETGMHRLGVSLDVFDEVYQQLAACPAVDDVIFMSHFACADEPKNPLILEQYESFMRTTKAIDKAKSLANTAGILAHPFSHLDWVRPGLMLYGCSPFSQHDGLSFGLRPVMTLKAQVMAVHTLKQGDSIGYGATWVCPEDMPVGVIAVGYGDGYPRHAEAGTPVLFGDEMASVVGRVSMDMITVDLRELSNLPEIGDWVTLWGDGLPAEVIARHAQTIPYELFCRLSSRVVFQYSS